MSETYFKNNLPNKYNLPLPTNLPILPSSSVEMTAQFPRVDIKHQIQKLHQLTQLQHTKNIQQSNKLPIYPSVNHIYNNQGKRQTLNSLRQSSQKAVWERALGNEWGRLAQGNEHGILAADTINFISRG